MSIEAERENSRALGRVLVQRRGELAISQRELGRRSGIGQSRLSRVEVGDMHHVELDEVARLAVALELSPAELVLRVLLETADR